ncbi:PKD domain-containing protein [Streptomyces sp. NPDC051016]|uniref:PKD domain-containing protein n=1 Tax=Streptomyces sp. NPDC051016 TaxID=3365638 RepID=UPI00379EFDDF
MDHGDFGRPYTDIDEWRTEPVPHRYIHGGFDNHATRFSFYFPPAGQYEGRFFQHITPVPESEHLAQTARGQEDRISFAAASGAYFVETNGGGEQYGEPGSDADPTIAAYRANAAAAAYSREVARRVYDKDGDAGHAGDPGHRPYGYAYGGSGGGFRTIGAAENTEGVWDGFVPYVIGSPMAIPNVFSVRMHAQRVLRDRLDGIVDALEPGGSGDPYADLTQEEADALREVTRMGFPLASWYGHRTMGTQAFAVLYPHVQQVDPGYFTDFWTVPGYLGADPDSSVHRDRLRLRAEVAEALDAGGTVSARGGVDNSFAGAPDQRAITAVRLTAPAPIDCEGAELAVATGAAAGERFSVKHVRGDLVTLDIQDRGHSLRGLLPGDGIDLDNSGFLAAQTYHRHQVPSADFTVWDQFRDAHGDPIPPQRPVIMGPLFAQAAAGTVQSGRIGGKMIVVACLGDREAFPWQADWYRGKVRAHLGDTETDRFRLWYVEAALHGDEERQEHPTRTVSYLGALHHALRDLAAWVEKDEAPPASTRYTVEDGQIRVPATAGERGGVQPVVRLTADGGAYAETAVGQEVLLRAEAEVPRGAGQLVALQWDFGGEEGFLVTQTGGQAVAERIHAFGAPGTYLVTVRARAQREGDASTPFARTDNLARVRVVVH